MAGPRMIICVYALLSACVQTACMGAYRYCSTRVDTLASVHLKYHLCGLLLSEIFHFYCVGRARVHKGPSAGNTNMLLCLFNTAEFLVLSRGVAGTGPFWVVLALNVLVLGKCVVFYGVALGEGGVVYAENLVVENFVRFLVDRIRRMRRGLKIVVYFWVAKRLYIAGEWPSVGGGAVRAVLVLLFSEYCGCVDSCLERRGVGCVVEVVSILGLVWMEAGGELDCGCAQCQFCSAVYLVVLGARAGVAVVCHWAGLAPANLRTRGAGRDVL